VDRRSFMASCAGPILVRYRERRVRRVWPADQDNLSFLVRRRGDALCRLLAQQAGQLLDRTMIVENRTGGDGLIGIKWVQNARPDGSTVLVTTGRPCTSCDGGERTELRFGQGFRAGLATGPLRIGVVVGPAVDAKDFKGFIAWLKANPGKATFGVPSNGTIPHFTGSKLEQVLGVPLTRVAYRAVRLRSTI